MRIICGIKVSFISQKSLINSITEAFLAMKKVLKKNLLLVCDLTTLTKQMEDLCFYSR